MEIYLIRHSKTATEKGLCYGQTDVPLAESFAQDFQAIRAKLPELREDCLVLSSPLQRCLQLADNFSRPVNIDVRLQEINFGEWENRRFAEIDSDLLTYWTENFVHQPPPQGESFHSLYQRVAGFWEDIIVTGKVSQVLVITHAGVIRALLAYILAIPLANAFKFQVDFGSVHKFRQVNNYTYVETINH